MYPLASRALIGLVLIGLHSGCAHLVETRSITMFTEALEARDLNQLKQASSTQFEHKALRLTDALDDLKILSLPTGETSVVNVEEVSPTEKHVTVEVGEDHKKRRVLYHLAKAPGSDKWVVDDVYIKQRKKGLTAAKSVTEQMDLLLTVREFLSTWERGERSEILGMATPDLKQVLNELPPAYLVELTKRIVGEGRGRGLSRPQAKMDEEIAIVRLPRTLGELVISFRLMNGQWKVDDLAVESRTQEDHISSVRNLASVVTTTASFLKAFEASDKQKLERLCTRPFYRGSLAAADLSRVALPDSSFQQPNHQIQIHEHHADVILTMPGETVKISLERIGDDDLDGQTKFLVEEVTLYENEGSQVKRVSALFTAHAMAQIFSDALNTRELIMLRHSSTPDFNRRVWEHRQLNNETIRMLPFTGIDNAPAQLTNTVFQGAVTEVTVTQGSSTLKYVLHDRNGRLLVDDVFILNDAQNEIAGEVAIPNPAAEISLKENLELVIPTAAFASAFLSQNIEQLQQTSSKDFNRVVWYQTQYVPSVGIAPRLLQSPLNRIERRADAAKILLGDEQMGAQISLISEHGQFVVDDVMLIADPTQHAALKRLLREHLATYGTVGPGGKRLSSASATAAPASSPVTPNF